MFSTVTRATTRAGFKLGAVGGSRAALSIGTARKMAKEVPSNGRRVVAEAGPTTFAALEARLNLSFGDHGVMEQVCTHKSYAQGRVEHNERLEWIGKRALNLFVGEHLIATYPNLSTEALQDVQHSSFGMSSLAEVGRHFGMQAALRWEPVSREAPAVGLTKVLGKAVQALVGAIYQRQGVAAARSFVKQHVLSRPVDVEAVMQIKNPKVMLVALTRQKGMEYPVARILKETGRFTSSPVFIVGVFCATKMVGMGFGSSLKMAEHRAAKDALLKYYAKEIKDISVTGDEPDVSLFEQDVAV
ncbi:54S ribosomal protein L3 mitochondrial [Coemansia sp. RSA 2337]|nr:54S ribosomal protein L3 mitochondrial [Coemansia sp. S680]KAJ2038324.1 54S ribosomal protein L3 mitochondrial [Coemansia sp. S3946]KAJ2046066.1 54S ribosomal protein L3 mitochondrial [Coemansia sp. S16]KAJ2102154.1 54S ribosomal protein L3 mitochondrial [Coemansia sp. S100]KAJ2117519.1 54S ribosomal protein L3 mitochondrial [Coemansia sp. RSA 922]KAJ2455663.1 54S ribosomal protein L3 mitochondrial [Coemansia sp. RSA 2337]